MKVHLACSTLHNYHAQNENKKFRRSFGISDKMYAIEYSYNPGTKFFRTISKRKSSLKYLNYRVEEQSLNLSVKYIA